MMGMLYEYDNPGEQQWIDTYIAAVPHPYTATLDTTPNGLARCIILTNGKSGEALSRSAVLLTSTMFAEDPIEQAYRQLHILKQFDSLPREDFDRWIRGPRSGQDLLPETT